MVITGNPKILQRETQIYFLLWFQNFLQVKEMSNGARKRATERKKEDLAAIFFIEFIFI